MVQLKVMVVNGKSWQLDMGANELPTGGVEFRVWAPEARVVDVEIHLGARIGHHRLAAHEDGLFVGVVPTARSGIRYKFRLNEGSAFPDPYSRSQPEGVHGPSEVVSPNGYEWGDAAWAGLRPEGLVIYECHVGACTPKATFDALAAQLPELKRLGITALELMPVAEFPGRWNWGYDGVDLYAPSRNYGGPEGLRRLVDEAHRHGIGVILDVVYNHLGPDGNYLRAFSPSYFTQRYTTPWGEALNYDGEGCKWVRHFAIQNACYWLNEFHIDGLRLDATHAIFDCSASHILAEITERARASLPQGRGVVLVAENENNDVRIIQPVSSGGYGFDAVWADDFHHSVHTLLTGENEGYYRDYPPSLEALARIIEGGFLYQGEHSEHLGRPRGTKVADEPARCFIFCIQNHDQIGNRAFGDRLNQLVGAERYLVASALLLLSPETPLLFMGQEFAASSPFLFFTDHNSELGPLVTAGRRKEFKAFSAFRDRRVRQRIPDPQAESTFQLSKLDSRERSLEAMVHQVYHDLISLRKCDPVFALQDRSKLRSKALSPSLLALHRWQEPEHRLVLANFGPPARLSLVGDAFLDGLGRLVWKLLWSNADARYGTGHARPAIEVKAGITEVAIPEHCAVVLEAKR